MKKLVSLALAGLFSAALVTGCSNAPSEEELKQLEDRYGRDRSAPRFSGRTLDIDILSYDDLLGLHAGIELPRPEISEHAFVLQPLADLLPDTLHPGRQISYAQMWQEFDRAAQHLWQVNFDWQAGAQDLA